LAGRGRKTDTSRHLFYGQGPETGALAFTQIPKEKFDQGIEAYLILVEAGVCKTRSEARRLIAQGGVTLNEQLISSFDQKIYPHNLKDNTLLFKIGKKRFHKVVSS
jgi:tyrosyl-tRNA synthetase